MTLFAKAELKDGKLVLTEQREIPQSAMQRCPHSIMVAEHYRQDNTCRCDDPSHTEMRGWGYQWQHGRWQ